MDLETISRKRDAKRFNEGVKLFATALNNIGIGIMGGAVIIPWPTTAQSHPLWIPIAIGLPMVAQVALRSIKSED